MRRNHLKTFILAVCCIGFAACGSDEDEPQTPPEDPQPEITVTTGAVGDRTDTSAEVSGTIDGVSAETGDYTYGICYGTAENPEAGKENVALTAGTDIEEGRFNVTLGNLSPFTYYYFRAYYEKDGIYIYGNSKSFRTRPGDDGIDQPTASETGYVDLGEDITVFWATYNVGAANQKTEESGGLYGWGDASGTHHQQPADPHTNGAYEPNAALCYSYYGGKEPLKNICGNRSFDIATQKMGEGWRLPSAQELNELRNICLWKPVTYNGTKGTLVIGPNGNKIFLPHAGLRYGERMFKPEERAAYWSGTLAEKSEYDINGILYPHACAIAWNLGELPLAADEENGVYRYVGMSVRAVRNK